MSVLAMKFNLRHIGIASENTAAAAKFWTEAFGFEEYWNKNEPSPYISKLLGFDASGLRTVKLESPSGDVLELLDFSSVKGLPPTVDGNRLMLPGITHIALTVPDLDEVSARLEELGCQPINSIQHAPNSGVRVLYLEAPDSVYLEVVQDPE